MTKISYLFLMTMIGVLFALGGCEGGDDDDTTEEEIEGDEAGECSDGADNDQDGLFDCDDAGCEGSPDCDGDDDDISDDDDDASDDDDDISDDDDDDTGDDDDTVSGWTFLMGSPVGEVGRGDDESQHHVTLTMDPEIGEKEVTQEEYEGLMGWNPSNCYYGCGDDIPVQYLSWFDAVAYTTESL